MDQITAGFALTGSFCTFSEVIPEIKHLTDLGIRVVPIMSDNAYKTDTRFGKAEDFVAQLREITGSDVLHTINDAEPIGPKKLLDVLIVAPCTGNTLAKITAGIADTAVTLAVKSHLRNQRPVLIGISTNDALSTAAKNIGHLHNRKHVYFIPYTQDDSENKPNSIVADFTKIPQAMEAALAGKQIQPILL
ncbi:MAG: dipicolinate synthase subunit B [Oscillospiraceae bacterium]|nr:dipicolinate synthase subunit B [Oscillospiraceae bacterium]